jgi:hypothetical protein
VFAFGNPFQSGLRIWGARPEPTQLEHLSDTSFLGRLVFLANVRLDWKTIVSFKHSSLFFLVVSDEWKKFYNIELQEGVFQDNSEKSGLCGKTSRQLYQEVEKW